MKFNGIMNTERVLIQHNVPMPQKEGGWGRTRVWPLDKMNLGDSFYFPKEKIACVKSATYYYGKQINHQFTIRRVSERSYGCWRIA